MDANKIQQLVTSIIILTVIGIAWQLINKFGDVEMAKQVLSFMLASGTTIIGFHFGEKSQR